MNAPVHSAASSSCSSWPSCLRVKPFSLARARRLAAFAAFRAGPRVRAPARTCRCQLWQLPRVAALSTFLTKLTKLTHPLPPLADSSDPPRYSPARNAPAARPLRAQTGRNRPHSAAHRFLGRVRRNAGSHSRPLAYSGPGSILSHYGNSLDHPLETVDPVESERAVQSSSRVSALNSLC